MISLMLKNRLQIHIVLVINSQKDNNSSSVVIKSYWNSKKHTLDSKPEYTNLSSRSALSTSKVYSLQKDKDYGWKILNPKLKACRKKWRSKINFFRKTKEIWWKIIRSNLNWQIWRISTTKSNKPSTKEMLISVSSKKPKSFYPSKWKKCSNNLVKEILHIKLLSLRWKK